MQLSTLCAAVDTAVWFLVLLRTSSLSIRSGRLAGLVGGLQLPGQSLHINKIITLMLLKDQALEKSRVG